VSCSGEKKMIISSSVSAPLPLPNSDNVLKEISLKYVTRYRAGREWETLKDDKVDAGALRTGCRLLEVTTLTFPFMASYPFKSPTIINDSERVEHEIPSEKKKRERERGKERERERERERREGKR